MWRAWRNVPQTTKQQLLPYRGTQYRHCVTFNVQMGRVRPAHACPEPADLETWGLFPHGDVYFVCAIGYARYVTTLKMSSMTYEVLIPDLQLWVAHAPSTAADSDRLFVMDDFGLQVFDAHTGQLLTQAKFDVLVHWWTDTIPMQGDHLFALRYHGDGLRYHYGDGMVMQVRSRHTGALVREWPVAMQPRVLAWCAHDGTVITCSDDALPCTTPFVDQTDVFTFSDQGTLLHRVTFPNVNLVWNGYWVLLLKRELLVGINRTAFTVRIADGRTITSPALVGPTPPELETSTAHVTPDGNTLMILGPTLNMYVYRNK